MKVKGEEGPRGFWNWKKILLGALVVAGFSAWYAFGFWDVLHKNRPSKESESYAAKKAVIERLAIDASTTYPVVRVIDGDTFVAKIGGEDITVRVLGMDAPETVNPKKPVQCYGPEASNEDKELLTDRSVTLETDPTQDKGDFYGRLLAYVRRDDGLFLEDHMIKEGFAREYTFDAKKPYEYQKQFREDQTEAQAGKKGLWGICGDAQGK
jgi:micrococcal nuclease